MKKHSIYCIVAAILLSSCSLFDELGGFQDPTPEGPYPSSTNYDSVMVIVAWDTLKIAERTYETRYAYLINPSYSPNSVDYVIEAIASLKSSTFFSDSLFVTSHFTKGDTLFISTGESVDTTFHPSPESVIEHIPEYNPEKKRWRIATHLVTKLHSINGVPLRE